MFSSSFSADREATAVVTRSSPSHRPRSRSTRPSKPLRVNVQIINECRSLPQFLDWIGLSLQSSESTLDEDSTIR